MEICWSEEEFRETFGCAFVGSMKIDEHRN